MPTEYPSYMQVVSDESHIAVPVGCLWRRHSYDLRIGVRGPRKWLPDCRSAAMASERPYLVVFLVECSVCLSSATRCRTCKPLGRPRLVPSTGAVVVDKSHRWQPKQCVPMSLPQYNRLRWQAYTATHRKNKPRKGKVHDGRGPITLLRKLRERHEMLAKGEGIEAIRFELVQAQGRDFDMLELALSRRTA